MALILHIETATTNCSVSLAEAGQLLLLKEHASPQYSHAEELHVFIEELMKEAGRSFPELSAVAVSKGPGSYTGLRIGVSAAKGLCYALDIPMISVSTLESLALHQQNSDGYVIPVLDARRMEVYSAVYSADFEQVREIKAEIIDETSFAEFLEKRVCLILGPGAQKCSEVIQHRHAIFNSEALPSAAEMIPIAHAKWETRSFEDVAYFEPFYLKEFITTAKRQ
ncbi:MAG: tRNA (adenosine(37)-N6)-threonylcarbamoyltransferase complex dimerization subunit type 1 TsaB [Eudoraea sp.]|nr:tRNA (adenosine(37)-N6)-threonylcarbamoyltransferase complex dimerization subunit type 1 TsaB [Eudoraea sp.]